MHGDTVKRTTWALRGADPIDMHINTIPDYSLYFVAESVGSRLVDDH